MENKNINDFIGRNCEIEPPFELEVDKLDPQKVSIIDNSGQKVVKGISISTIRDLFMATYIRDLLNKNHPTEDP